MAFLARMLAPTDTSAIHDDEAGEIAAVTDKASPVAADLLLLEDPADSNNKKSCQVGNLPFCTSDDSRLSDDRTASGLRTATTVVSVSGAPAPSAGQALVATANNAATWQTVMDATAVHDNVSGEISAVTEKTDTATSDLLLLEDSNASYAKRRVKVSRVLPRHTVSTTSVTWSPTALTPPVTLPAAGTIIRFSEYDVECVATSSGRMTVAPTRLS